MKERLLFVAAGQAQVPAIREACAAGYYVIAMDGHSGAPGLKAANDYRVADILDPDKIIEIFKETGAQGIVSISCEVAMEAVAIACKRLAIPGTPLEAVHISRNKLRQRQIIHNAGLTTPKFRSVSSIDAALQAWNDFATNACVIKPIDASGSRGVSLVDSIAAIPDAIEAALAHSPARKTLVETFVSGTEYSVEAWAIGDEVHVLATSEKARTQPPYLLDRKVHFPDALTPEQRCKIVKHAVIAIRACGFRDCPVHLECIYTDSGPVIVELSARGAGFRVFSEMLPRVTGLSTTQASIETALGKRPNITCSEPTSAATLAFIDPTPGRLKAIHGLENARAIPGVAEIEIYTRPGDLMNTLRSGNDRIGHIIAYDSNPSVCRQMAQDALDLIRIEVEIDT